MKKVLIVTYYWPPAGGPSVQRVLKFAKYLPEFGWEPVILTVQKGEYFAIDPTLMEEARGIRVYRTFSLEPGTIYRALSGMRRDEPIPVGILEKQPEKWSQKVAHAIRRNLFIPDAKIGWFPFAVREGMKIIQKEKPDVIFSSSPPPTVHLIAHRLSRNSGLPFVADFRDPWTDIYYYKINPRHWLAEKLDRRLEKKVVTHAAALTCVTRLDQHTFSQRYQIHKRCYYIPNGYDEADFHNVEPRHYSDKFTIVHMGSLNYSRQPTELLQAVQYLITEKKLSPQEIQIIFVGNVDQSVHQLINQYQLNDVVKITGYLEHIAALQIAATAWALLLINFKSPVSHSIILGKTYEYLRLRKPILAVTPLKSELADLLSQFQRNYIIPFEKTEMMINALLSELAYWREQHPIPAAIPEEIRRFERKHLTAELAEVFNSIST